MVATNRRQFLKGIGGATLGALTVTGIGGALWSCSAPETTAPQPATPPGGASLAFPWPYQKLDPVNVAERAYTAYYNGGCMYGAFEGIVGELREQAGPPFDKFPAAMMKYGAAGVIGWGTLCGDLNGVAAAIYLVRDAGKGNPIINEVYGWYGAEPLPDYQPKNPKFTGIITTVSDSPLCHVSVTRWSNQSGFKTASPERAERCAWLTASVAKHTVELLNSQLADSFRLVHAVPAPVTGCLSCHAKGGAVENIHITSQTSCTGCHADISARHPVPLK